jgi:hypothetical protein
MKHTLALITSLALAACGSKSSTSTGTTPTPATPSPTTPAADAAVAAMPPPPPSPIDAAPAAPDPAAVNAALLADEQTAYDKAKPVFEHYCASCHTQNGKKATKKKLSHFDMTSYPFGGHHAATIGNEVREVLGLTGEKPTMPDDKPGSVKGDDLAAVDAWAQAWIKADKAGAHGAKPAGSDHDDDDDKH